MTGVSMITSTGSNGQNVMAAEWTMQISYEPMLIAIFIHEGSSTLENIRQTKEFGVNVASEQQTTLVSIAGGYSRKEIDKLSMIGFFQLVKSQKIKPPLIEGCVINAECKVFMTKKIGDHTMIVGKVISIKHDPTKKPLVYHQNRYFGMGSLIEPIRRQIKVDRKTFDLFSNMAGGKFILKCTGVIVKSRNRVLVCKNGQTETLYTMPHTTPQRGQDQKKALETYLREIKLDVVLKQNPTLKRLILKTGKKMQRINFILFTGTLKTKPSAFFWKPIKNDLLLQALAK